MAENNTAVVLCSAVQCTQRNTTGKGLPTLLHRGTVLNSSQEKNGAAANWPPPWPRTVQVEITERVVSSMLLKPGKALFLGCCRRCCVLRILRRHVKAECRGGYLDYGAGARRESSPPPCRFSCRHRRLNWKRRGKKFSGRAPSSSNGVLGVALGFEPNRHSNELHAAAEIKR
jgi:hypothetical protein